MSILNVALLQMTREGFDQEANLEKGDAFCRKAKALGADIALFPEMYNVGYRFFRKRFPEEKKLWLQQAVDRDGDFVSHFRSLAKELEMAVAVTYLERWQEKPRNSVTVFDRKGAEVLTYAKTHICAFSLEAALTPGDELNVCELDIGQAEVKVGCMICYDREFPEPARILMLKGAEIILVPNACPLESNRLAQFRTRAFENITGMAMTNYAAPQINGHSAAYDGICFLDDNGRDTTLVEAGEEEGVYIARFDIDALREYRRNEVWGWKWRRPSLYGLLSAG